MSEKIVQLNEEIIKGQIKLIVGGKCMGMLGDGGLGEVVLLYRLRKAAQPHHGLEVFEWSQHLPTPFS